MMSCMPAPVHVENADMPHWVAASHCTLGAVVWVFLLPMHMHLPECSVEGWCAGSATAAWQVLALASCPYGYTHVVPHRCPAGRTGAACRQRRAHLFEMMSWELLATCGAGAGAKPLMRHAVLCHTVCHVSGVGHPAELGCGGALLLALPVEH